MSDLSISSNSRDNQQTLDELRLDHEKRMQKLRADQKAEEDDLRQTGDAAVNHIRQRNQERLKETQAEGQTRITQEEEGLHRNYENLRTRTAQTNDDLARETSNAQYRANQEIQNAKDNELRTMRQSQVRLKEFISDQQAFREQAKDQLAKQAKEDQQLGTQKIVSLERSNDADLQRVEKEHDAQLRTLKSQEQTQYEVTAAEAKNRLHELQARGQTYIETERDQDYNNLNALRDRVKREVNTQQLDGERRLSILQKTDQKALEDLRRKSELRNSQLQTEYSSESDRIEREGAQDVADREAKFKRLEREQTDGNNKYLSSNEERLFQAEQQQARNSHEHLEEIAKKDHVAQAEQRKHFQTAFETSQRVYKDSLQNQKENYLKELYKQNIALERKDSQIQARADDPFYRMKALDTHLTENNDHYVFEAKIPAHEKDDIDVHVKDDKISLVGRRSFSDAFKEGQTKTATSSYQTFRQDFELAKPADASRVQKFTRDDGTLTVIIPKKGFANRA